MFWLWILVIISAVIVIVIFLPSNNKINSSGTFEIVGEAAYQSNLKKIAGPKTKEAKYLTVSALIESEPTNKHDRNALKVTIQGLTVGYLSREEASYIAAKSTSPISKPVMATIVGGWKDKTSEGQYGVKLLLTSIDDLLL